MDIMKKTLTTILVILSFGFMSGVSGVYAAETDVDRLHNQVQDDVSKNRAILACEYSSSSSKRGGGLVQIYYYFAPIGSAPAWQMYYTSDGYYRVLKDSNGNIISTGDALRVFENNKRVHYQAVGTRFKNVESSFKCPNYSFVDVGGSNFDKSEICLSDSMDCGTNFGTRFNYGPYKLQKSILDEVADYALKDVFSNRAFTAEVEENAKKGINNTDELIKKYTVEYIKKKYSLDHLFAYPAWLSDYVDNFFETYITEKGSKADLTNYDNFMKKVYSSVNNQIDRMEANGDITPEEAKELRDNVKKATSQSLMEVTGIKIPSNVKPSGCPKCNGLLGAAMTEIVNNIFDTIKFAGPILVAVLTMMDFLKAVPSGNQDEIKKATQKFGKRAVAAILLFFIPLICNILFSIAGITVPEICIGNEVIATECVDDE